MWEIGKLIFQIGIENDQLNKGLINTEGKVKEFVARQKKNLTALKNHWVSMMSQIKLALAGAAVSFGYIVKKHHQEIVALNDLSIATDIAVESLAGLKNAFERAGGEGEDMITFINRVHSALGREKKVFEEYGIAVKDAEGKLLPMAQVLANIQLAASKMSKEKLGDFFDRLGANNNPVMQNFFSQTSGDFSAALEEGVKNAGISEEAVKQADRLQNAWREFMSGGAMDKLAESAFKPLADALEGINDIIRNWDTVWEVWGDKIVAVTVFIGALVAALLIVPVVALLIAAGVTAAGAAMAAGIAVIVAAVLAVVALIIKNWDTIKAKAIELWDFIIDKVSDAMLYISEKFDELSKNLSEFLDYISDGFSKWIHSLGDWLSSIPSMFLDMLKNAWNAVSNFFGKAKDWVADKMGLSTGNVEVDGRVKHSIEQARSNLQAASTSPYNSQSINTINNANRGSTTVNQNINVDASNNPAPEKVKEAVRRGTNLGTRGVQYAVAGGVAR